ncbi:iron ABC transporter permease [Natronomonas salina]|uniref:ABC transporter permease n=1 Tax=Natronomonas salina TaxID=1710540 RepID=UPI0015B41C7C|nr:iron ABC transporter permease [Natronomonas salina]QLD90687.1 iron ABC transporter permease [Natronomonas salina]
MTEASTRENQPERPLGLTLLSGAVAAALVFPLTWVVVRAAEVETGRATEILLRPRTHEIFLNSLLLMVGVTVLSILLAVPLAVLTVRTDLPGRRFWTVVVSLPLAVPSWLGAFAFVAMFRPRGIVQGWLEPLGVRELPDLFGLPGAVLLITLYTYPYVFITTRAALKTFDKSLVDAARTLNHGWWDTFRRVTLPQIRPAIAAGALLAALYAVSDFGTPAFLQAEVFTRAIYQEQRLGNNDYAAFLSLQLVALTVFILAVESRVRRAETLYTSGTAGETRQVELGAWKWPAVGACLLLSGFTLVMPVALFTWYLFTGQAEASQSFAFQWSWLFNSAFVAGLAALVAAVAAVPVAYLSARYDTRLGSVFERATYVGYAVPGIVVGLALVFFGAHYGTISFGTVEVGLYLTLPVLVFAYVVRFMPQAVGSTRTSILQVNPTLAEAARTLGKGPLATFRSVTLPLIAPGVVAGAALVFLTTMKELPATLMLRPTGFETLVTRIWAAESAGLYRYAALPALLLLVVSGLSMVLILRQEE